MTDRDLPPPADPQRPSVRPVTEPLTADSRLETEHQLEAVLRGDRPIMSVTTISRPPLRVVSSGTAPGESVRALLDRLMTAAADLPPFSPVALRPLPTGHRLPAEAHAAARASGCPDLFVVHATDPLAGERVIADVAQASLDTATDGRVLVLSPNPTAADRITERLVRILNVSAVRALAEDENPARLSPVVTRRTSTALGRGRLEQVQEELVTAIAQAEARLAQLEQLTKLRSEFMEVDSRLSACTSRLGQIETEVRADPTVAMRVNQMTADAETTVNRLTAKWQAAQAEQRKLEAEVAADRNQQLPTLRKPGFFARLFGSGKPRADSVVLATVTHDNQRQASEAAARVAALEQELETATAELAALREQAIRDEITTRQQTLETERATLTAIWQQLQTQIDQLRPTDTQWNDLEAARNAVAAELAEARQRVTWLNHNRTDVIRQYLAEPRVVVATPGSLGVDPVLEMASCEQCPSGSKPQFSLLILDRAEELTEADFVRLSHLATRWVLVGDTSNPLDARSPINGTAGSSACPSKVIEAPFLARLAQALDRERWVYEGDRLVCRLTHLTPQERRTVTREPVLDRPEIELRIGTNSTGEPVLAEVAFPVNTPVADAKAFLFRQLGEVLLQPCGELCWEHTATLLIARWPAAEVQPTAGPPGWLELEPGVRECVVNGPPPVFTAAVTFDSAAGWDIPKAEAWLALHVAAFTPTRLAMLPRTHTLPRAIRVQ